MSDQLDIDFTAPAPNPRMLDRIARLAAKLPRPSIEDRCAEFDRDHPEVYAELRRLALEAVGRGRRRLGIAQLVEVARWNLSTTARDDEDGYEVNNDFRAIWARRLMAEEPALRGVFETRDRSAP